MGRRPEHAVSQRLVIENALDLRDFEACSDLTEVAAATWCRHFATSSVGYAAR
jgi:hypothetical protein